MSFEVALGRLLDRRSLSASSNAVKALNFTDPAMRGLDLRRSILNSDKFSKNMFCFKTNLMKLIGAKNEGELNKKIIDFEFKSPLMILRALAAQFNRLEMRYILNGISFQEAYVRRLDFDNAFMCICSDLCQFGLTPNIIHCIHEFSSELVNPKLNLDGIMEKNTEYLNKNNNNTNKRPNLDASPVALAADRFVYDGNELIYNINEELGCQIKLITPISDLYNNKRFQLGSGDKIQTLKERWISGERPKFCPNKSCWDYNWGVDGCPHAVACKIKKEGHELSHYCAFCGEGAKHRILECEFLRCCTVLVRCTDSNWLSRTYSLDLKRIFYPRNNKRGNRRTNSRGGYRNFYQNAPNNGNTFSGYNNDVYDSTNVYNNFDNFGSYNNDSGYNGASSHHYNNNTNNGGRRGGRNKRRNRDNHNNNNNGQFNSPPHNGNA